MGTSVQVKRPLGVKDCTAAYALAEISISSSASLPWKPDGFVVLEGDAPDADSQSKCSVEIKLDGGRRLQVQWNMGKKSESLSVCFLVR
jgi:hypothetical protein